MCSQSVVGLEVDLVDLQEVEDLLLEGEVLVDLQEVALELLELLVDLEVAMVEGEEVGEGMEEAIEAGSSRKVRIEGMEIDLLREGDIKSRTFKLHLKSDCLA